MAIRNANKEDKEYAKKLAAAKAKLAAAKAAKATPQGSVKVVPSTSNTTRADNNHLATLNASRAKSGRTAREGAQSVNESNAAAKASGTSSAGTVKINSKRVRTPRITGGLMGGAGGGNWRNLFK